MTLVAAVIGFTLQTSSLLAEVSIKFNSTGVVTNYAGTGPALDGTWVAQLIFSPTVTANAFNPSDPLNPGSGDIVLAQLYPSAVDGKIQSSDYQNANTLPAPFGVASTTQTYSEGTYSYGGTFAGGYVYYRLFDDPTPTAGDHYYQSSTIALGGLPGINQSPIGNVQFNNTIVAVPEPTTVTLLGLGLALIGLRSVRRKA